MPRQRPKDHFSNQFLLSGGYLFISTRYLEIHTPNFIIFLLLSIRNFYRLFWVNESVEEKYGDQVKVIFYVVWTENGKQYAKKYNINLIPTQVFLNENGKEFFRHEFFSLKTNSSMF